MTSPASTQDERPPVTVLGLGRMGTAIAAALLSAGHRTTVWNRSAGKTGALGSQGAVRAETKVGAVLASPVVIACLSDYQAVRQLLEVIGEAVADRTLINLTTGTPEEAQETASWAGEHGARYVDGAMMAVPQTVGTPDAFFLYSGSEEGFEWSRPALDVLATSFYLGEDPAVAELWDTALLGTGYGALAGFLQGLALLETAQVRASDFVPLVSRWLSGMVAFLPELAAEIESGDYTNGVSPVDLNRPAVHKLIGVASRRGVDAAVHAPLAALLDQRSADGHGAHSFSSLFELMRAPR